MELLVIALHSSPVEYWTPFDLGGGGLSSGVISFFLFILLWGSHGKNTGAVFHSVLQWTVLCQNSTMTHPSWVALYGMAHSFIELHKPLCHDKAVIHEGEKLT